MMRKTSSIQNNTLKGKKKVLLFMLKNNFYTLNQDAGYELEIGQIQCSANCASCEIYHICSNVFPEHFKDSEQAIKVLQQEYPELFL